MKNKKVLIVCLVFIIVASIITNIYIVTNKNNEIEDNQIEGIDTANNQEILKDTTQDGLKITNISLLTRDGISTYKAEVTNITKEDLNIDKLYVIFYENDIENKVLALSNVNIKSGEKTNINITSEDNLSNTTSIKYLIDNKNEE